MRFVKQLNGRGSAVEQQHEKHSADLVADVLPPPPNRLQVLLRQKAWGKTSPRRNEIQSSRKTHFPRAPTSPRSPIRRFCIPTHHATWTCSTLPNSLCPNAAQASPRPIICLHPLPLHRPDKSSDPQSRIPHPGDRRPTPVYLRIITP